MATEILPFVPGVYTCAERGFSGIGRTKTGGYLTVIEDEQFESFLGSQSPPGSILLFDFIGAPGKSRAPELRIRSLWVAGSRGYHVN